MKAAPEAKQKLRGWILANGRGVTADTLTDDTPLLERRIITSLQIMDLILLVEELSGKRIQVDQLKPGTFRNVRSILARFFEGET